MVLTFRRRRMQNLFSNILDHVNRAGIVFLDGKLSEKGAKNCIENSLEVSISLEFPIQFLFASRR